MKKHVVSAALTAAMVLGCVPVYAAETGITLTEAGKFQDPNGDLDVVSEALVLKTDDTYQMYNYLGEAIEGCEGARITQLTDDLYVLLRATADGAPESQLVRADGTVLIPFGPAIIETMSDQYLKVVYAEEVTESEDEAIMYVTSSWFSLSPSDEDTLYTGYATVYNLETEAFLDAVHVTSGYSRIYALDDVVYVDEYDANDALYNPDGTLISDDMENVSRDGAFFTVYQDGMRIVYDNHLNRLFDTNYYVDCVDDTWTDVLMYCTDDDQYGLLDTEGNVVLDAKYEYLFALGTDYLKTTADVDDESYYGVIKKDGTVVLENEYDTVTEIGNGYYMAYKEDENGDDLLTVISPTGAVYKDLRDEEGNQYEISFIIEDGSGYAAYVFNDGDYTLKLNDPRVLDFGLVADSDPISGKYAVYDVVTGEQLTGYDYSAVAAAYGHFYAYKDGEYTVYEISR